jgi:flagellar hook-basal body complex protein FliE
MRGITGLEGPTGPWAPGGAEGPFAGRGVTAPVEGALGPTPAPEGVAGVSFGEVLGGLVGEAATRGHAAAHKAEALAAGAEDDLHGTMIAAKESEISLKLVGTIRTKLLEAFHELWRTGV